MRCIRTFLSTTLLILSSSTSIFSYTSQDVFAKYPNKYFVETGSNVGIGIQMALDAGFPNVLSVELKESYYEDCKNRFASRPEVKLYLGNSSNILPLILSELDAPATFWLDWHFSGPGTAKGKTNTPLMEELEHIKNHYIKTHTILIDDIRLFDTEHMDFITMEDVLDKIREINPDYIFKFEDGYVRDDVLVATVQN